MECPPRGLLLTGRITSYLDKPVGRLPVSCTVFVVQDTYTGKDGIAEALTFTSYGLRNAAGVAVHLSNVKTFCRYSYPFLAYIDPAHPDAALFEGKPYVVKEIPSEAEVYRIADSMESTEGGDLSIESSWVRMLNHASSTPLVYDFSAIRPRNTDNGRGIVASGPFSFYTICCSIYDFLRNADLLSLMAVFSKLNEVLRRGGLFKNGAVVLHLDYTHPQVEAFITAPRSKTAWARLCLNVDEDFLKSEICDKAIPYIRSGDLFVVKKIFTPDNKRIYHNVCLSDDNYILTKDGPRAVTDLISKPFVCAFGDRIGVSNGFFATGERVVFKIHTLEGYSASATSDHRFQLEDGRWEIVDNLRYGMRLRVIPSSLTQWGNRDSFESGFKGAGVCSDSDRIRGYLYHEFEKHSFIKRSFMFGRPRLALRGKPFELHQIQIMLIHFGIYSKIQDDILYVVGHKNLQRLQMLVPASNVSRVLQADPKQEDPKWCATVSYIEAQRARKVYDASVQGLGCFSTNGLVAHNCLEILLESRATCLLAHVNLGLLKPQELPTAFEEGMRWLCKFHSQTGVDKDGVYKSPSEDRQVGLGVVGLANHLAIEEVTYAEFVKALTKANDAYSRGEMLSPSSKAETIAVALVEGFDRAAKVAKAHNMVRAFTVAPTASCSYKGRDRHGYTTAPEIAPPIDRQITRLSETMQEIDVDYHPDCEIAEEVGWETYFNLVDQWMRLMDLTGLGHSISSNWWSDKVVMDRAFLERWFKSHWKSLYYAQPVTPRLQDKSEILFCDLTEGCTSCAE